MLLPQPRTNLGAGVMKGATLAQQQQQQAVVEVVEEEEEEEAAAATRTCRPSRGLRLKAAAC